jgi:hypothetical protein
MAEAPQQEAPKEPMAGVPQQEALEEPEVGAPQLEALEGSSSNKGEDGGGKPQTNYMLLQF